MPAELPIGFGIALAGGLAFQLGIVLGAPAGEAPRGDPVLIDNSGDIIASDGGSITFGSYERNVTTYTLNQQLAGIDDLYDAVMRQRMDKRRRAAVVERLEDLNGAVEGRAGDKAIDQRLRRVTDVLYTAGALTGGATAVFASLLKLAGMLGTAGQGVYDWLNPQRR
jgi:hypothetical protein